MALVDSEKTGSVVAISSSIVEMPIADITLVTLTRAITASFPTTDNLQ